MSELHIKKVMDYIIDNPQYKNRIKLIEYSNGNVSIIEYWYDKEIRSAMTNQVDITKFLLSKIFSARECFELWGSKQKYHDMDDYYFGEDENESQYAEANR